MDYEYSINLNHLLMQREMGGRVHGNPKSFTAHLFRERYRIAKNLYSTDLWAHYGCVNAIEFSNGGKYLASGGDDKRVLIWDVEKAIANIDKPEVMDTEHTSNIFCLGFDNHNKNVFSGGNDDIVIAHDFATRKLVNVFKHENPVYGLSIDSQNDNIFATACEVGQILVYDMRVDSADPFVLTQMRGSFHAVEFHPNSGFFLVTANSKSGAAFWDLRKPHQPVIQYGYADDPPSCMSVRFNYTGNLVLALRRRLPPILYNTQSPEPVCTFYHSNYYNSCTMKSCTFAGEDDELVISGSDDFNLYIWRISDVDLERTDQWIETTQMVLYGHRSIVNQVRYNRQKCLLASSGVEKIVKLWSPFSQNNWSGCLLTEALCAENPRELYSPNNFASMASTPHSWSYMSHDYSTRNTNEDPRMMAFFDSLIQQEIEGWETDSSTDSFQSDGDNNSHYSTSDSTDSSFDDDNNDDNGGAMGSREGPVRRSKRVLVRKKERKARKSSANKIRVQRHKYANRIAYLIATKRNTLRRLAIKDAARRPHKIIRIGPNNKATNGRLTTIVRAMGSNKRAAASAAMTATATAASSSRVQRRKYKRSRAHDTTSDENDDLLAKPIAGSSNRFASPSNEAVPSTSTGITSSLKDAIMRLRRQQQHIIDSDEDEDDDEEPTSSSGTRPPEVMVDPTVQPTKKLNGVRRSNDAAALERSRRIEAGSSSQRVQLRQMFNEAEAQAQMQPEVEIERETEVEVATGRDHVASIDADTASLGRTTLPQSSDNPSNHIDSNHNPSTINCRRRPHPEIGDNYYSSQSNSRLSNSSCQDDTLDLDSSSASESQQNEPTNGHGLNDYAATQSKRRKISALSAYINSRAELPSPIEENNNEQNNNDIYPSPTSTPIPTTSNRAAGSGDMHNAKPYFNRRETTPRKPDGRNHYHNEHFTPDSGISMSSMATPNHLSEDSLLQANVSGNSYIHGYGNSNSNSNGNSNGIVDSVASTSKKPTTVMGTASSSSTSASQTAATKHHKHTFQQKVARVRRNYRKKFAEESDSD